MQMADVVLIFVDAYFLSQTHKRPAVIWKMYDVSFWNNYSRIGNNQNAINYHNYMIFKLWENCIIIAPDNILC